MSGCQHAVLTIFTQAKDLVAQLLVVDPSQRLSAMEALAHPWIQVGQHGCGSTTQ